MSWFRNVKIVKEIREKKATYVLTAEIEDGLGKFYSYEIESLVKNHLVETIVKEIRQKYIDDLVKSIDEETIRKRALEAFKDDIRDRFTRDK